MAYDAGSPMPEEAGTGNVEGQMMSGRSLADDLRMRLRVACAFCGSHRIAREGDGSVCSTCGCCVADAVPA